MIMADTKKDVEYNQGPAIPKLVMNKATSQWTDLGTDPVLVVLHKAVRIAQFMQGQVNYKVVQIWPGLIFFVTIIAHHSSNSQTGLNRF